MPANLRTVSAAAIACAVGLLDPGRSLAENADASQARARVTALADRYVAEYRRQFPISYAASGMPIDRHDGIDVNSPAQIEQWHRFLREVGAELKGIQPEGFAGSPEWVTWHFLNQSVRQDAATTVCRNELWNVSAFGWQAGLTQVLSLQPVGTDELRAQALERWRALGPWVDQEIANLREGQRLGFSASQATVKATVGQLDGLLEGEPAKSAYMDITQRDATPAFVSDWTRIVTDTVFPALARYRDFLRDDYLPRARGNVSIDGHPGGRECYSGLIFSNVTITGDPGALYELAVNKVAAERKLAVQLGRKIYGDKASDWNTLAGLMRADPRNKFASKEQVREYTQRTYERANAAAAKMVLTPPVARVKLEPFPEFQQASAPGGQYLPAADDGSRPATYYYRDVPGDLYKASLQNVILHETLPGHHLQIAFLAEHGRKENHPIARLLFFSGPGEGWASYAEDFAREIGLYDSDFEYIGALMGSITPMMVTDLGMQVKGWTTDQAIAYLREAMPMRPPERAAQSVATISGLPSFVMSYPLGAVQWEKMRARAQSSLGAKFDVRAFHQRLLEDGMLPFAALEAKTDRFIANGGK